jgi:hypothetical protein
MPVIRLAKEATNEEILRAVRDWVDLLAADRYEEAREMMVPDNHWTPQLMRAVVRHYGFIEPRDDGRTFAVTPIAQTVGGRPRPQQELERFDAGGGIVHFDLPLNGAWSDLTAVIEIEEQCGGLVLRLADIHVL